MVTFPVVSKMSTTMEWVVRRRHELQRTSRHLEHQRLPRRQICHWHRINPVNRLNRTSLNKNRLGPTFDAFDRKMSLSSRRSPLSHSNRASRENPKIVVATRLPSVWPNRPVHGFWDVNVIKINKVRHQHRVLSILISLSVKAMMTITNPMAFSNIPKSRWARRMLGASRIRTMNLPKAVVVVMVTVRTILTTKMMTLNKWWRMRVIYPKWTISFHRQTFPQLPRRRRRRVRSQLSMWPNPHPPSYATKSLV
mmetsp:Transcript_10650/g.20513  ORF Transcript_10650/g.20513 Transcript_10650/m.20513 type:complete len:252 (-) Transcript_10650:955-1710(-)